MAKQLQLSIPTPCHENWDNMTPVQQARPDDPVGRGKFCDSCQKQVVDFSNMSDRQVAEFFKKPSTGSVCGRFMSDQLERDIEIPKKRIPWLKFFFQFAIPAFLLSIKSSSAKAQGNVIVLKTNKTSKQNVGERVTAKCSKPLMGDTLIMPEVVATTPVKYQVPGQSTDLAKALEAKVSGPVVMVVNKQTDISETRDLSKPAEANILRDLVGTVGMVSVKQEINPGITGKVIDEKGDPVPFASIETNEPGKGVMADENGSFKINKNWLKTGSELLVSSAGFECKNIVAGEETYLSGELLVQLKVNGFLKEVVVSSGANYRMGGVMYGQVITFKKEIIIPPPVVEEKRILVFPNPVQRGATLNLTLKKLEEGYYQLQLINLSGQPVLQQEIRINAEEKLLKIDVPPVAAGSYFLSLINKKSGKRATEKIIIQ